MQTTSRSVAVNATKEKVNHFLIAAAPQLLEACKAALEYIKSDPAVYPLTAQLKNVIELAERGEEGGI